MGMRTYVWRRLDTPGLEIATWQPRADGAVLAGRVLLLEGELPLSVDYRIEVDGRWMTRLLDVDLVAGGCPQRCAWSTTATAPGGVTAGPSPPSPAVSMSTWR